MKKILFIIFALLLCFTLMACGYSESEKFDIAKEMIESDINSSIQVGTMMEYGVRDVDLKVSFFEEDAYSTITVQDESVEPKAYRIKGSYYLDGVYIDEFEGVYAVTFYKNSREIGPIHQQSLTY